MPSLAPRTCGWHTVRGSRKDWTQGLAHLATESLDTITHWGSLVRVGQQGVFGLPSIVRCRQGGRLDCDAQGTASREANHPRRHIVHAWLRPTSHPRLTTCPRPPWAHLRITKQLSTKKAGRGRSRPVFELVLQRKAPWVQILIMWQQHQIPRANKNAAGGIWAPHVPEQLALR